MGRYDRITTPTDESPEEEIKQEPVQLSQHHSTTASQQPAKQKRKQDTKQEQMLAVLRASLLERGTESTSYRLTKVQKERLGDAVYALKKHGYSTSENELARLAIDYLLTDWDEQGDDSVLVAVMERLYR